MYVTYNKGKGALLKLKVSGYDLSCAGAEDLLDGACSCDIQISRPVTCLHAPVDSDGRYRVVTRVGIEPNQSGTNLHLRLANVQDSGRIRSIIYRTHFSISLKLPRVYHNSRFWLPSIIYLSVYLFLFPQPVKSPYSRNVPHLPTPYNLDENSTIGTTYYLGCMYVRIIHYLDPF